jgi:phospholipase/carboxylesterase
MALAATNVIWWHWPGASGPPVFAVRGTVAIDSGFAFFHRLPDRSIDENDISERTPVLAQFIQNTTAHQGITRPPIVISYSNGAIMVSALLLTHPSLLAGAVLFWPLSPFKDKSPSPLNGNPC